MEFSLELSEGKSDYWVQCDIGHYIDQHIEIGVQPDDVSSGMLDEIRFDDALIEAEETYQEKFRPQYHFTSKLGWLNDPNGLLYYGGEYHLFYQHNPYGVKWGNMHWGHAVSSDLVYWDELGDALFPDEMGTMFSGSGVVDAYNTTNFKTGEESPLVLIYTAAGGTSGWSKDKVFTQCLAFSNDKGRTWTKYEGNPVLENVICNNRDPKVIWHDPSRKWIMALYLEGNDYALFSSKDLKYWERTDDITLMDDGECPDLFELPVDGDENHRKWVFWGAKGKYLVGTFDGARFSPESEVLDSQSGNSSYAAQTWSDIPVDDGRRIQISWGLHDVDMGDMPFNKHMTFPTELTLRSTEEGIRLFTYPIREIEKLRTHRIVLENVIVTEGTNPLDGLTGELFEIDADIELLTAASISFDIRGIQVIYRIEDKRLFCLDRSSEMKPLGDRIQLKILVDRTSIEIFGNSGRVYMPMGVIPSDEDKSLGLNIVGGQARIVSMQVYRLRRIWG